MPRNSFPHDLTFRIIGPIILGIVVYLLILMLFDSFYMLEENFFSREVLFTIIISLLFSESNRLLIAGFENAPIRMEPRARVPIQIISGAVVTVLVISSSLYFYFTWFEGFTIITPELIAFNSVYFLMGIFYHLYYFSLWYLDLKNEKKVIMEDELRRNMETEIAAFKLELNPDLLYHSLENIILCLRRDPEEADHIIAALADVYRYRLKVAQRELVEVKGELTSVRSLLKIFSVKENISLDILTNETDEFVIPGSLLTYFERALHENIKSMSSFNFEVEKRGEQLVISHPYFPKLLRSSKFDTQIDNLRRSYEFYGQKPPKEYVNNQRLFVELALIKVAEEAI